MGLDSFMGEGSSTGSSNNSSSSKSKSNTSSKRSSNEPYKVIGRDWQRKVFQSKEDWDETVEYIEEELGFNINVVLSWPVDKKFEFLHRAILGKNGSLEITNTDLEKQCIVCDHTFTFPNDWDYSKYKEEVVCPTHTIEEVEAIYEEINDLHSRVE